MGFGTDNQIGNRTSLADMFRNNIGAPQPMGTIQQPNQLFNMLQALLGNNAMQPPAQGGTGQNMTPLSGITAQPASQPTADIGSMMGNTGTNLNQLSNPFGKLINQRFIR